MISANVLLKRKIVVLSFYCYNTCDHNLIDILHRSKLSARHTFRTIQASELCTRYRSTKEIMSYLQDAIETIFFWADSLSPKFCNEACGFIRSITQWYKKYNTTKSDYTFNIYLRNDCYTLPMYSVIICELDSAQRNCAGQAPRGFRPAQRTCALQGPSGFKL